MDIIYEDDHILIVNKPSGLIVTRKSGYQGETLEDQLRGYFNLRDQGVGERAGIVHRLDRETSGLLIVAKTEKAFGNLQGQFKERKVKKKYWALVYGELTPSEGVVEAPLARNPKKRKKFCVFRGGKDAVTSYKVVDVLKISLPKSRRPLRTSLSLLEVRPLTGRTHQIRVHLESLGHAVVGDPLYSGRKRFNQDSIWCPRLFLHAFHLGFIHPGTGKEVDFESFLPCELREVLDKAVI